MGYNIGPKIGIEGEAQFRQQIKAINNEYKTLQAQTKALTAEFDKNGDQQGKLKMQTQQLEKQIENQKQAIEEMEKALEVAAKTTDANSDAVTTWEGKLYNARATVAQLEKELQDTEDALRKMEDGVEDTGEAADDAGEDISEFGDILKGNLVADAIWDGLKEGAQLLVELGKNAVAAASELRAESAQFEQTFGEMEQAATQALKSLESQTGISATRIKGNFSTVYAFAKTMGSDSEEALDIASRAMAAAADSAAYYDKTVEEVTETIQAYIKGNYANDAALGIASTETTRNAAALERYGKAFKELSEAQKVDTLLAMVEAGNKASGAMGQAAREAAEWTNVTGELEDAWTQLLAVLGDPILDMITPVIQDITEGLREMTEVSPGEQLAEDMHELQAALEQTREEYEVTTAKTLATATVATEYALRLQELEQQGLDNAEAQREYENVVTSLNALIPELNLSIDEQTGLINQNAQALLGDIEAWKKAATTQAMYARLTDELKAYGEAQVAVAEAEAKRDDLLRQQKTNLETLNQLLGISGAARVQMVKAATGGDLIAKDIFIVYDKAGKVLADFKVTAENADSEIVSIAKSCVKAKDDLNGLRVEIAEGNEVLEKNAAEIDRVTALVVNNTEDTEDNADAQQKQAQAAAEVQAALLELEAAYQEAEKSTRAMLDSSIGLWDEMAKESDWTAKKVLQNWRDQMKAFDSYSANLEKAKSMGLSDGIIEALSDGSQQSMQILDAMVNQSQYSVGEINAAFTDLDLAKDGTADVLMSLDESLQEGYDKLVEDAKAAGLEIVDGIVQAIEDNAHKVGDVLADNVQIGGNYYSDVEDLSDIMLNLPHLTPTVMQNQSQGSTYFQFDITQLPGESAEDFAERVAQILQDEYERKRGGLGG